MGHVVPGTNRNQAVPEHDQMSTASTRGVFDLRPSTNEPPIDRAELRARMDDCDDVLVGLFEVFRESRASLMAEMRRDLSSRDFEGLAAAAHSMKGAAGCFMARPVIAAASALERIALAGDSDAAHVGFATLDAEMSRLIPALDALEREIAP
jgi:HPt (histidine-containing phosphotransfer) domain-containing protein